MTRQDTNKARPPVPADVVGARRRAIVGDFLRFLLLAIVMLGVGHALEESAFGRQVRIGAYELIQARLRNPDATALPVIVVGIDGLAQVTVHDGLRGDVRVTPRDRMYSLLESLTLHAPRAIGVDVDFSPENGLYQTGRDPDFFAQVQALSARTGVRIVLGVDRTRLGTPDEWLGDTAFAPLAASIVIPFAEEGVAVRSLPLGIAANDRPVLPSLAAALVGRPPSSPPPWLRHFVERYRNVTHVAAPADADTRRAAPAVLHADEFLVDFGAVDALRATQFPSSGVTGAPGERAKFAGRYVLVGDVDPAHSEDRFALPGHPRPVPGVFAHASAVYTLIAAPLYELTPVGGFTIDLAVALLTFALVAAIRWVVASRVREDLAVHRINTALALATIALVWLVGHALVPQLRLVWLSYALVILVQLLHLGLERVLEYGHGGHGPRDARPWWRRALFERRRGR